MQEAQVALLPLPGKACHPKISSVVLLARAPRVDRGLGSSSPLPKAGC